MGFILFELKKILKQKKIIWLLLIIILWATAIFTQNYNTNSNLRGHTVNQIDRYSSEIGTMQEKYIEIRKHRDLTDIEERKSADITDILFITVRWKNAAMNEKWDEVLIAERDYIMAIQNFDDDWGETFMFLQGLEREITLAKNNWLKENELVYEEEIYPTSPHLILKELSSDFLGLIGVILLVILFGNIITGEKEDNTWLLLKTQPLSKWEIITGKYITLLFIGLVFIVLVLVAGYVVPYYLGGIEINLQYPQVLIDSNDFLVISTGTYLARNVLIFLCGWIFASSLVLLFNKLVKNTFTVNIVSISIFSLGYFTTNFFEFLQSPINPFHFFQTTEVLQRIPQLSDWAYPFMAIIWSVLLLWLHKVTPSRTLSLQYNSYTNKPFMDNFSSSKATIIKIIMFEWRKLLREGLLKRVYIFLSIMLILGYLITTQQTSSKKDSYIESLEDRAMWIENYSIPNAVETIERERKRLQDDYGEEWVQHLELLEWYEGTIDFLEEEKSLIEAALQGIENEEWHYLSEYQLFKLRWYNNEIDSGSYGGSVVESIFQISLDASISEKHWILERNIQPIFPGEFLNTFYQHWGKDIGKEWAQRNTRVDNSGLYSLLLFFEKYLYILPIVLFLFLLGGGIALEKGKKQTYNFLKTQPLSEGNIYFGKIFSSLLISVFSTLVFIIALVAIATIYNRLGDWQYPTLFYDAPSAVATHGYDGTWSYVFNIRVGFHFINLGTVLMRSLVLIVLLTVFTISLSMFYSIIFSRGLSVLASTIITVGTGYWFSAEILIEKAHLLPFIYFEIPKIVNGEWSAIKDNPSINFTTACIVLITSVTIISILGYLIATGKNISKVAFNTTDSSLDS